VGLALGIVHARRRQQRARARRECEQGKGVHDTPTDKGLSHSKQRGGIMGRKALLFVVAAILGLGVVPAVAFGTLVNEYGLHFAGQSNCVCHQNKMNTLHGQFATPGLTPAAPSGWTVFKAAGDPPVVAGTSNAYYNSGGSYSISGLQWVTLGNYNADSATEYLVWKGSTNPTVQPWNIVEGLTAVPGTGYDVGSGAPTTGLYDATYSCQRCHMLGSTKPAAAPTYSVPNPAASVTPTPGTAMQWARDTSKSVSDFMTDPAVSQAGMGIQCEQCHGTGVYIANSVDSHGLTHTQISDQMPGNTWATTLGQSQVCGQCHGSYTDMPGTLGIYGFTPNLKMRNFVNVNGVSGGQSYTKIPTDAEFMASPTAYWMFPNGSNAKGSHYYYDEWAASGHSYRGALTSASPDAMAFQAAGNGHYGQVGTAQSRFDQGCYKCHTGEGYMKSKNTTITKYYTPTSDNVGLMGQECTVCHSGHPSAVGASDVVRAPDAAGERSAYGLTKANDSICEDCHNWQYEVQGTHPVYAPMADLSAHGGASHPQRETLNGYVMVEVPKADAAFMPGAKCEDCHMVKTNKAANRISHGMKPMLPGNAEKWNTAAGSAYMGQDSCSGCHAGESRDQLQVNIDKWQADAKAAADTAAAAITAAQTRPEFSMTDPSNPGYILVGKATWNYKAWENDASGSVHNPKYVLAGLVKAQQMADSVGGSLKITAPLSVVPGGFGFVSGKAVDGDGSGAAAAEVKLLAGGTATGDTTVADAKGNFTFMVTPAGPTTYSAVWMRSSDTQTQITSGSVTINIAKDSSKTIITGPSSIKMGKTVNITGGVIPADAGNTVRVECRKGSSGSWKVIGTVTLDSASQYAKSYKPGSKASWYFRATYAGSTTVAGSTSATIVVKVK
jgi:hypothetical protein